MDGLDEYEEEVVSRLEQLDPETEVDLRYKDEEQTVTPDEAIELLEENMADRPSPDGSVAVKDWYLDIDVREDGDVTEIELEKGTRFPDDIQMHEERDYRAFERPDNPLVTAELRYGE